MKFVIIKIRDGEKELKKFMNIIEIRNKIDREKKNHLK